MTPAVRWPAAILGLIGLNMCLVAVTIYYATSDPSAAVEPDYYRKALAWDQIARERAASQRLGWSCSIEFITPDQIQLALRDRGGGGVSGARVVATAFAEVRAANRITLDLDEVEPARYGAVFTPDRPGRWRFQIEARRPIVAAADRAGDHGVPEELFRIEQSLLLPPFGTADGLRVGER